jgi:hypothetical protein
MIVLKKIAKPWTLKKTTKRWIGIVCGVLFCLWLGFVVFIGWAMRQPPEVFGHVMSKMPMPAYFLFPFETMWSSARKGTLNVGDKAPDITVKTLDAREPTQLASLWAERPVVLVFGSYT